MRHPAPNARSDHRVIQADARAQALNRLGATAVGYEETAGRPIARLEPSIGCIKLIAVISGSITLATPDGAGRAFTPGQAFVATPRARPVGARHDGALVCVEYVAPPWAAEAAFGPAALECDRGLIAFDDIAPRDAARLADALRAADAWPARFAVLMALFERRAAALPRAPDARVRQAWDRLRRGDGLVPIRDLAAETGWSPRRLAERFRQATGLSPKAAARRLRFLRAHRQVAETTVPLAEIAALSGYADQSHMTREFVEMAGAPPGLVRRARFDTLPGTPAASAQARRGRRAFVQDGAITAE